MIETAVREVVQIPEVGVVGALIRLPAIRAATSQRASWRTAQKRLDKLTNDVILQ